MSESCPACNTVAHENVSECSHCGFSYNELCKFYSGTEERLKDGVLLLTDKAGVLSTKQRQDCKRLQRAFAKKFPGLFFAVYFDADREISSPESMAIWLLNRAEFLDLPQAGHSQYGVLLYVNVERKTSVISFGKGLESYLNSDEAFHLLSAGYAHFQKGNYLDGIDKVLEQTSSHLSRKCPA